MQRIFSGIRPTGVPHLGNYLGAIRNWVPLQRDHECIWCAVDLHAITQPQDPAGLAAQTRELVASLLACGLDPRGHIVFAQSHVHAHARLAWIFMCVARIGWLDRMTQFKDKAGKDRENVSAGLFTYPVLMSADVLAYHATRVPVGDDQRQHLELANDIAQKFNHDCGVEFFQPIEPLILGPAARVMSLRDGSKKMSKSDPSAQSRIDLTDDADAIALKVRRAKTDPEPLPEDPAGLARRPEARNLVGIYAALADTDAAGVLREHGGKGFGAFKEALAERLVATLGPIAAETRRLLADPAGLDAMLADGAARAAAIADPIVAEAERLVGLLPPRPGLAAVARRLVFFTIVANNYLAYARTLMGSLLRHHPSSPRYVVLCDEPAADARLDLLAELIPGRDLGIPEYDQMAFWYDVMEFATAIKPSCFRFFFERHPGCDVVYLDPDILVTNRLAHVERALAEDASLVLTPHITAPLQDGAQPDDLTIMKSGVYNLGFMAAAPVQATQDFIRWWHERCLRDAVVDIEGHRFTDQRWADLAPSFVARTHILHHPGYNLAYWNLVHRPVRRVGADILADGRPLRFVHFSGVVPGDRTVFSKHQTRFTPEQIGELRPLFDHYLDLVAANGWDEFRAIPYAYGRFRGGRSIHPMMRWSYRRHQATIDDPFAGNGELFDTLEPALASRGPPGVTRVVHEIWHRRRDLQQRFDIEDAAGREGLLTWFTEEAARTENVDAASLLAAASILGPAEIVVEGHGVRAPWPPQDRERFDGPRERIAAWLAETVRLDASVAEAEVPIPRHLALLWEDRPDLQQHFMLRNEAELNAFIAWALTFGLKEGVVDTALLAPAVAPFLDQVTVLEEDGAAPATRVMHMLAASYSGEFPSAIAEFPATPRSREAMLLWALTVATVGFDWPPDFVATPLAWCRRRAPDFADQGPPVTNLLHTLWSLRRDVRELCNLAALDGQVRLIAWVIGYGMRELRLPLTAISDELFGFLGDQPDAEVPSFRRLHSIIWTSLPHLRTRIDGTTPAGKRAIVDLLDNARSDRWDFGFWVDRIRPRGASPARSRPVAESVLVTGLVREASGRGEDARLTAAALATQGVPVTLLDRKGGGFVDPGGEPVSGSARWPVDIVHHNADSAPGDHVFLRRMGQTGAHTIGYWAWELARLPAQWHNAFAFYDEIWASTRFAYDAFAAVATKPVFLVPLAVQRPAVAPMGRPDFGLPAGKFLFFFGFDLRSYIARKNPQAAIAAFRAAFAPGDDGVGLVIKTLGATDKPAAFDALTALTEADPRIVVQDREYAGPEHAALVQCCDCYVSLHRSEGFGRGPAEAMALGKPVIATAYSGNMDFMTPGDPLLVDYRLVPVEENAYPGWQDQEWADADIDAAAGHMRAVRDDPALAARLGQAAARDILRTHAPEVAGRAALARLRALDLPFLPLSRPRKRARA